MSLCWCSKWDLNPHDSRQRFLGPPCLPIPAFEQLVGVTGFEPATHASQMHCATKLRYTPIEEALLLRNKLNFDPSIFRNVKEIKVISREITHNA